MCQLPNVGPQKNGSLQLAMLSDNSFTDSDKRTPIHLVFDPKTHWKPSEGWQIKNAAPL